MKFVMVLAIGMIGIGASADDSTGRGVSRGCMDAIYTYAGITAAISRLNMVPESLLTEENKREKEFQDSKQSFAVNAVLIQCNPKTQLSENPRLGK